MRHQVNNLLAPVTVAAELLDDGSETAALLTGSVTRLRDVSTRLGDLLHLGEPSSRVVAVANAAGLWGFDPPEGHAGHSLAVDPERFLCNVVCELQDLGRGDAGDEPALRLRLVRFPCEQASSLVLSATLPARMRSPDADRLAIPFAVPGADVRLAMVCRETHLHAGRVGLEDEGRTVSVVLPLC